ncbi:MAG: response regulator [Magnetococcales bacterium]|nr:response regulator [Magnetococcales bacterium]
MKILLVDDDEGNLDVLEGILSPHGECDRSVDGREAVEFFEAALRRNEPYDLVCLDIMMPEMNGQDALKAIRAMEVELDVPLTVIWMVTALDTSKEQIEAIYKGGCNGYITKPYTKQKIMEYMINHGFIELKPS